MSGNYTDDFARANLKSGNMRVSYAAKSGYVTETPAGFTWHHTEYVYMGADGKIYGVMELVETQAHKAAPHSGGVQLYKELSKNTKSY